MREAIEVLGRGLFLLAAIVFLAWRMYRRWRGATEYVDAMREEERRERASFERMPWDPHFMRIKAYLDSRYRTTLEKTADPAVLRIHYAAFLDQTWQPSWKGQPAKWLVTHLRSKQARIMVTLDLATGYVTERPAGWADWDLLPVWAR